MNAKADPQRIIATNIRTTAAMLAQWKDDHAQAYGMPGDTYRQSFNAWIVEMIQRGRADAARRGKK